MSNPQFALVDVPWSSADFVLEAARRAYERATFDDPERTMKATITSKRGEERVNRELAESTVSRQPCVAHGDDLAPFDRSDQTSGCSHEIESYVNHRLVRSYSGRSQSFTSRSNNGGSSSLDQNPQASPSAPPMPSSFLTNPAQNARLLSSSLLPPAGSPATTPPSLLDEPLTQDQSPSCR
ncbi:hypothetical protein Q7P35_006645 [Cladosporium inversicolor]